MHQGRVDSERLGVVPKQDHLSLNLSKALSEYLLLNYSIFVVDKITFFRDFTFRND